MGDLTVILAAPQQIYRKEIDNLKFILFILFMILLFSYVFILLYYYILYYICVNLRKLFVKFVALLTKIWPKNIGFCR